MPTTKAAAQERPTYQFLRAEEDWRLLRDPARRTDPLDPVKAIPISDEVTLTLGGDLRTRFESYQPFDLGFGGARSDSYLLTRTQFHADLRAGDNLRAFVQLRHGGVFGERARLAPVQDEGLELAQGFVDLSAPTALGRASVRLGRQEVMFGSGRFVNPRDGPNTRLSFDGARLSLRDASWGQFDAFYLRPVQAGYGDFDDRSGSDFEFYGAYAAMRIPGANGLGLDLYYFGFERPNVAFGQGRADERRDTFGARLSGRSGGWDWDLEGAIQTGRFGRDRIRGYAFANDIGYTFRNWSWTPRVGLRADLVSGDGDLSDRRLGNFELPFPKLPYLVEASLVAPANIVDLHPTVAVSPRKDLKVTVGYAAVWKHRAEDAFYLPPLRPVAGTADRGRFATSLIETRVAWSPIRHADLEFVHVRADPSAGLERAGARSTDFFMLSSTLRF